VRDAAQVAAAARPAMPKSRWTMFSRMFTPKIPRSFAPTSSNVVSRS
jgi:hypothetical protein